MSETRPGVRPCPLCGESSGQALDAALSARVQGAQYRLQRCRGCGLAYTDPLPDLETLKALYSDDYYVTHEHRLLSSDLLRILFQRSVMRWRRRRAPDREGGRVLDVGCGNGDFLHALGQRAWQTFGTEFSPAAAALARAKGIEVRDGDLRAAAFPDGFFDLVTFWHVVEHLTDPLADLREAKRVLRPGGMLLVEVPDLASPGFRFCREHWCALDIPRHLQHFTPDTLGELLRCAGFSPARQWNFHHWDFTFVFYSLMGRLGLSQRLGIDCFSTGYKRAGLVSRLLYLAMGVPVALFSLACSPAATLLSGHGESVTVAASKPRQGRP